MGRILAIENLDELSNVKKSGKKMILAGGCFDILHRGHIEFLQKAKKLKGALVVLLESDKRIRELKGEERPINNQEMRAAILSNLGVIDYVVTLPYFKKNDDYEKLVKQIQPDIIAVTKGELVFDWEKVYMEKVGGKVIEVTKRIKSYSTSKLITDAK